MTLGAPLGTAVEGHDDEVATFDKVIDDAAYGSEVGMFQGVTVVAKGTETDLQALALDDGTLDATIDAREQDALLFEYALGRFDALKAKVVGVVVGHAQEVETCLLQQMTVTGRRAESVGVRPCALGATASVADGALEIAHREIGSRQNILGVAKKVSAIVGREHDAGVGGTHHDIASHGDVKGLSMEGGNANKGECQAKQADSHKALSSVILRAPT